MAGPGAAPVEMLSQLEAARKLALADPQVYNQVVPGIMPIIGPGAAVDVRRWGADFLAECFGSPSVSNTQKEQLSTEVLPTLKSFLDNPGEDAAVVRSVVQASASIYPMIFRRIISQADQAKLWQDLTSIKLNILQRMDSATISIRICCIKFVQKVVQVETPGMIADPRRAESNETSIALVPRNHPLLSLPNLEAEASGLLDRLLSVFHDNTMDPIVIDATLNCLAVLIRSRPAISNKILTAVLNFNPLKQASASMTPRLAVIFKSMERTTRALLRFVMRSMPNHPFEQKVQAYLLRLQQSRTAYFSDSPSLKRPAEPTDGLDDAKRQRLTGGPRKFPPLPPPPNTIAQLFTLTEDPAIQQFDVKHLPIELIDFTVPLLLKSISQEHLDEAINGIRARFSHLTKANQPTPIPDVPMAGPTGIDDDDEYDPEFDLAPNAGPTIPTEQSLDDLIQPAIDLGPFELPKPPPLTGTEISTVSDQTVEHVEVLIRSLEAQSAPARQRLGLNRLAASANDRDAWITILLRLATRTPPSIAEYDAVADDTKSDESKSEDEDEDEDEYALVKSDPDLDAEAPTVANRIRQRLFMYILEDFRSRLNVAISWLSEEWYADKIAAKSRSKAKPKASTPNYDRHANHLLSSLLPYLDARDKNHLIRFLSEIPAINPALLQSCAQQLARDPERIGMFVLSMQYLLMFRPPVRKEVLDVIESVWNEGDSQVKGVTGKVLQKWRPATLAGGEGLKQES